MFGFSSKLSRLRTEARSSDAVSYDEKGRGVIRMTVRDESEFLSPYALSGMPDLNSEVADFLEGAAMNLRPEEEIVVEVSGSVSDEKKSEYRAAIRNHYRAGVREADRKLSENARMSFVFALIAAVVLSVYVALEIKFDNFVVLQLVDITAWVFMWEAVDLIFLERKILKSELIRSASLYSSEIVFAVKGE